MKIGVLALQGGVAEHCDVLSDLGVTPVRVRAAVELDDLAGLLIPGGESTTISLLADRTGLRQPICELIQHDFPVFGTCAGMIMLADRVTDGRADRPPFGGIDMTVARNAFGRQRESFEMNIDFVGIGGGPFPAVFIRAPAVIDVGPGVGVLSRLPVAVASEAGTLGRVVAVRHRRKLAVAFHPELTNDTRVHEYFLQIAKGEISE
jgi:5'-phosphate synthase pdxT subunit